MIKLSQVVRLSITHFHHHSQTLQVKEHTSLIFIHTQILEDKASPKIITELIQDVESRNIKNLSHASTLGKPVYKKLGFKEVNEWMEINYDL